jgi:hypothetical protein
MHIKKTFFPRQPVLYIAIAALLLPVFLLGLHLLQTTGGVFSLPHDKAFLQLSTAKTLAFQHIWGIGRYDFASASPSLLYPVVLAVTFFICGAYLAIVPIINTVIAIILLAAIQQWLAKRAIRPATQLLILLAVIALTPLPVMVIYGMERTLLLLLSFLFVSRLSDEWTMPEFSRRTLIYGALMVATRYDGVFLIAGISLLLIYRRKWLEAFELALWSLLPILVFGITALFKGSYFLPNVFLLEPAGSQFSYDWLIGCGIAVAVPLLQPLINKPYTRTAGWTAMTVMLSFAFILLARNLYAYRDTDRASIRISRQEYPVARFLRRYYNTSTFASDDVGVMSYFVEGRFLDLSGRASNKVARSKSDHFYSPWVVGQLTREDGILFTIVSDRYTNFIPEDLVRTASWKMPASDLTSEKVFTFYARDTTIARDLTRRLKEHAAFLPPGVSVRYFYTPIP